MVLKLIRLLAVAMALVIPLQGMAALAAGICMSAGHHQGAAADEGHAAHGHDADEHAVHSHDETVGEASAAEAGDAGETAHCGPCAACCASASIAGAVAFMIAAPPTHPQYVFSQHPPLGFQPRALDRPPLAL